MFLKGSRYAKVAEYVVTDAQGVPHRCKKIRFIPPAPGAFQHTVKQSDRIDLIAFTYYHNPEKFWLIADANNVMVAEDLVEAGRQLIIPPDRTS